MNFRCRLAQIGTLWRRLLDLHPDVADLLAWADAEPGHEPAAITSHLACCGRCRTQAIAMRAACSARRESTIALSDIYAQLDLRMRAWCSLGEPHQTEHRTAASSSNRRLLRLIELYFGEGTAQRISESVRADMPDRQLLPATQPLFYAFLGRRAAEALLRSVAES